MPSGGSARSGCARAVCLSLAIAASVAGHAKSQVATVEMPEIDALIARGVADHNLPGAVVAVGHRDGLVFLRAYGERALVPAHESMSIDTVFDLASLTKPIVTATLLMQLVEAGRVQLDTALETLMPELHGHPLGAATVRQLLLHESGMQTENSLRDYAGGKISALAKITSLRLLAPPGQRFIYSDLGFIVLGALVERISGESLDGLARRRIFVPLGMHDTRFRIPPSLLSRVAPTEVPDDVRKRIDPKASHEAVIRGDAHDPRAFLLGGVAGNAGLFSTAADLARFARMLLGGGALDTARVLTPASVDAMSTPHFLGDVARGLGWDMRSRYSGLRGHGLSARAFGHGGYTGTSLWIDPERDLFVLLLSNRVHPHDQGHVIHLAGEIADVAARYTGQAPYPASCAHWAGAVQSGIDVLRQQDFAALAHKRIALVANGASRARDGTRSIDLLHAAKNVELVAVFAPEHGVQSVREGAIDDATDAATGLPVFSLYGSTHRPTPQMLHNLDAVVFDLQDVGARFYTYLSTLRQIMEAAAEQHVEVFVLDRPNPLGAFAVEGPVLDRGIDSFVNYHSLPIRHGMSAGEIALLMNDERSIHAKLTIIRMQGYRRELGFAETGLPWFAPSPNLPTADAALLYPATGLLEGTNLSVGRGTEKPFALLGAPWVDAGRLVTKLGAAHLPGARFTATHFTPKSDRYAGKICHGVLIEVTNARAFLPVRTGLTLAHELLGLHPRAFYMAELGKLVGDPAVLAALLRGVEVSDLEALLEPGLQRFEARRNRHLLYPNCDSDSDSTPSAP